MTIMIIQRLKQIVGSLLISLCAAVPAARPLLKRWGLRTSKEWFGDRVVQVRLPEGGRFKLASVSDNYLSFELFWRGAGYYDRCTPQRTG